MAARVYGHGGFKGSHGRTKGITRDQGRWILQTGSGLLTGPGHGAIWEIAGVEGNRLI